MRLAALRALLLSMLLGLTGLMGIQFALGGSVVPFLAFLTLSAIVGPFWPDAGNIERWALFFDRWPISYLIGNIIVVLAGAGLIWYGLHWNDPSPSRLERRVLRLFGREGPLYAYALSGWLLMGAGLLGCIRAFRKNF